VKLKKNFEVFIICGFYEVGKFIGVFGEEIPAGIAPAGE